MNENNILKYKNLIPIVINPNTPVWSESIKTNVEPIFFSKSNEIFSILHIWKNVLYWILVNPEFYINGQYKKQRDFLKSANLLAYYKSITLSVLKIIFFIKNFHKKIKWRLVDDF